MPPYPPTHPPTHPRSSSVSAGGNSPDQTVNTQPFNDECFHQFCRFTGKEMRRYTCIGEPQLFPPLFVFSLIMM